MLSDCQMQENAEEVFERRESKISRMRMTAPLTTWFSERATGPCTRVLIIANWYFFLVEIITDYGTVQTSRSSQTDLFVFLSCS